MDPQPNLLAQTAPPIGPTLAPPSHKTLDPSIHSPFYDVSLKKVFCKLELYAKAFPHSWEAGQFRFSQYDLSTFTPAILHADYTRKTTPTYVQAAGSGPRSKSNKAMRT